MEPVRPSPPLDVKAMPSTSMRLSHEMLRRKLELRSLTARLQHADDWMPRLQAQGLQPAQVFESLHRRRHELLRKLAEYSQEEREDIEKRSFHRRYADEQTGRPDLAVVQAVGKKKSLLDNVFSSRSDSVIKSSDTLQELLDSSCSCSTRILQTDFLSFNEYPGIEWKENKEEDVQFWKVFGLGPADDLTRSVLAWRAGIINPAPFDWPLYEERNDWAQLCINAAVTFDIPAPRCDSYVFYEATVVLALSPYFNATDYFLYSSCILCEQPDASQGAPTDLGDFEYLGNGITISDSSSDSQIEQINLARSFFVPKRTASKVHVGFTWNCNVASGEGGTALSCWNNFIVFRPASADIWGLKVTTVPVE